LVASTKGRRRLLTRAALRGLPDEPVGYGELMRANSATPSRICSGSTRYSRAYAARRLLAFRSQQVLPVMKRKRSTTT